MRSSVVHQTRQIHKDGRTLFVDMWISPAEYPGRRALLVTTSDITKRLEAEQQLIQASKMATLGEMATGVAHELNQPLAVIKTASRYFIKKTRRHEPIPDDILSTMSEEIDSHVDRATRIINHMREFGRKTDLKLEDVFLNEVLKRSFEIFSQQLKVRGIEVIWDLAADLPPIKADANRLEQVFINLLINARDAIETRFEGNTARPGDKTHHPDDPAAGRPGAGVGPRHGCGHSEFGHRQDFRTVFHHQGGRQGDRPGAVDQLPDRSRFRRRDPGRFRGRRRGHLPHHLPGGGSRRDLASHGQSDSTGG